MGIIDILESNSAWDFNSDIYKAFILFVDIISSLLYISLQTAANGNRSLANGAIAIFAISAIGSQIAMIVIAIIILLVKLDKDDDNAWPFFIADCSIIVGTLFYFVGDNLPPILGTFSEELSLDQESIQQAQTAGRCLLFIALIFFQVVPKLLRKWMVDSDGFDKITDKNEKAASFLIHMLALMVEYDAIYSAIWGNDSILIEGVCSASDLRGSWTCWSFSFVFWIAFVVVYFFLENEGCGGKAIKDLTGLILMIIALCLVCVSLGIYLLGDNNEPIGCVCNGGGFNSTISDISSTFSDHTGCSDITGKKIRSGLMGLTGGGVLGTVGIIVTFLVLAKCM